MRPDNFSYYLSQAEASRVPVTAGGRGDFRSAASVYLGEDAREKKRRRSDDEQEEEEDALSAVSRARKLGTAMRTKAEGK